MAFITDATLKTYLQAVLKKPDSLVASWDTIITVANNSAYYDIVNAFLRRGYTKSQVDQWDRGAEFQKSLGLWWCLEHGAAMDPESVNLVHLDKGKLDRRMELEGRGTPGQSDYIPPVALTINGEWTEPLTDLSHATTGEYETSDDLFMLDPDDRRRGEVTQF